MYYANHHVRRRRIHIPMWLGLLKELCVFREVDCCYRAPTYIVRTVTIGIGWRRSVARDFTIGVSWKRDIFKTRAR
jgi:hypothetical protein